MKECTKCKEVKELSEFYKSKVHKDGRLSECKVCKRAYQRDKYSYDYYKQYRKENNARFREATSRYTQRHPAKNAAKSAKRRCAVRSATPPWADQEIIQSFYSFAKFLEAATFGQKYHVDHIVPLKHHKVCGLHVEQNLQVLRAEENLSKGNKFAVPRAIKPRLLGDA